MISFLFWGFSIYVLNLNLYRISLKYFLYKGFYLQCVIVWGAPLLCEKAGPDGVPQKGSAGMIITDIVDDNVQDYVRDFCVYVRRFCLELAQPI